MEQLSEENLAAPHNLWESSTRNNNIDIVNGVIKYADITLIVVKAISRPIMDNEGYRYKNKCALDTEIQYRFLVLQ